MSFRPKDHPAEYTAYNEMKRRMKAQGLALQPILRSFPGFMGVVGPKPDPTYSLDRIMNENPVYEVGNIHWASKRQQANNRRNTRRLTYTGSVYPQHYGRTLPVTEWAEVVGVSAQVIRQRIGRGWSENDALEGTRSRAGKTFSEMTKAELVNSRPWTKENAQRNEESFLRERKGGESRWEYRERRLAELAADKYHAVLQAAEPKFPRGDIPHVVSSVYPDLHFKPYLDVSREELQRIVEEWRAVAIRWLNAHADAADWRKAMEQRNNSLADHSRQADRETLKRFGMLPSETSRDAAIRPDPDDEEE